MENKRYRLYFIVAILFFVLFSGSVFLNYQMTIYLDEYEEQFERQDSMIKKLSFSNDLVKEYFDIEEDTVAHTTIYSLKESKRDKEVEHITKYVEPEFIRDGRKMTYDEMISSINANDHESVEAFNSLVNKYNTLLHEYNELGKKLKAKSDTVTIQGMALGLIKRNYGIEYLSNINGDVINVQVIGEKVDSALMLLPYYRHKLFFDPQTKMWGVEYQRKVVK